MSKPRYKWWQYARKVMFAYPGLLERRNAIQTAIPTSKTGAVVQGGRAERPTENNAMRELSPQEERELQAVLAAIDMTRILPHGDLHVELIRLVFWKSTHTLRGAASVVGIEYVTACKWQQQFIVAVGAGLGFI